MGYICYCKNKCKIDKTFLMLVIFYVSFLVFSVGYFIFKLNIRNLLMSIVSFLIIPIYLLFEYYLKIEFSNYFLIGVIILASGGILLGPAYDFYHLFPLFDNLLHTLSGFLFCILGFTLAKRFLKTNKKFAYVIISIMFSLSIALIWEMIEFAGTTFFGFDMQEDCLVDSFRSYFLANSHNDIVIIENITETIIYYGDNQMLVIEGYLDLGVYDTLIDMLVCLIGSIIYLVVELFDKNNKLIYHRRTLKKEED